MIGGVVSEGPGAAGLVFLLGVGVELLSLVAEVAFVPPPVLNHVGERIVGRGEEIVIAVPVALEAYFVDIGLAGAFRRVLRRSVYVHILHSLDPSAVARTLCPGGLYRVGIMAVVALHVLFVSGHACICYG